MKKKTNLNLIGISGYIGSGKDTFANMIQAHIILSRDPDFFNVPKDNTPEPEMWDVMSVLRCDYPPFSLDFASGWATKTFAGKMKDTISLFTGIPRADLDKREVKESLLGSEWAKIVKVEPNNGGWELGTRSKVFDWYTKPMRVRDMFQILGTNALRDIVHPDIHINGLFADYKPYPREQYPNQDSGYSNLYAHMACKSCGQKFRGWKRQRRCATCIETEGDIYPNWIVRDVRFSDNEAPAIKNRGGIIIRVERPGIERGTHASETSMDGWEFDYVIQNDGTFEDLFALAGKFCHDLGLI